MNSKELVRKLKIINQGLSVLTNPKGDLRRVLEESGRFDLILSVDLSSMEKAHRYLNDMDKLSYKPLLDGKGGLANYSPEERIKSGVKALWRKKTYRIKYRINDFKEEDKDLFYEYKRLSFWYFVIAMFMHLIVNIPTWLFILLAIGTKSLWFVPILILSCWFSIWHFRFMNNELVWRASQ